MFISGALTFKFLTFFLNTLMHSSGKLLVILLAKEAGTSVYRWNGPLSPPVLWAYLHSHSHITYYVCYVHLYHAAISSHDKQQQETWHSFVPLIAPQCWFPMQNIHNGPQLRMHNMYILRKLNAIMSALNCISARYAVLYALQHKIGKMIR